MKLHVRFILAFIDVVRPFFGSSNVCIYPTSCREYAKRVLQQRSICIAVFLIIMRVVSCNPLTALILSVKNKYY